MQSLLSPAESHAFQSFLSTMDYTDDSITPSEWAIFNSQTPMFNMQDDSLLDSDGNPERREALTKATKDLMSLDADGWDSAASLMNHNPAAQTHHVYDLRGHYDAHQQEQHFAHQHAMEEHQRQQQLQHIHHQQEQQRQNGFSSGNNHFPFLHNKAHQHPPTQELRYPMQRQQQQQQHPHLALSPMNTSNSDHGSPTTPSHSHPFGGFQQQQTPQHQNQQVHIPPHPDHQRGLSPASGSTTRSKRLPPRSSSSTLASSGPGALSHSTSVSGSNNTSSSSNGIRSNLPANGSAKRVRSSSSPSVSNKVNGAAPHAHPQTGAPKQPQTLLSPSQKKANHIQSEQKRRANIRRGYEALCETVPALREAIREEEETERNASNGQKGGNAASRKKGRGKKGQKESDEKEKDKLDGRAGPRSENVVLSKTIEHIQDLISDRSALLARLHRARSTLPPGHSALSPVVADPPWEREWKGGSGRLGDEDPEGDGESDGEDDGEDGE